MDEGSLTDAKAHPPEREARAPQGGQPRVFRKMEHAWQHLDYLYEISKQLAGFEGMESTFPEVMELANQVLSLRTAFLLVGMDSGGEPLRERPTLTLWRAAEVSATQLLHASEQAASTYAWLVGAKGVEPQGGAAIGLNGPGARVLPGPPANAGPTFVNLPLVSKGLVFGTLQVEASGTLAEEGLALLDAVTNQLALALDRYYALRREVRLRERAEALERAQRELLQREHQARMEIEESHRNQALLAEVSATLAASLDYRSSLPGLARLLVPAWADCCAIDLFLKEPRSAERIAMLAEGPPGNESFMARVLASHPWVAFPADPAHLPDGNVSVERAEWADFPSNLRLLIQVRGRTFGVLSLISARPKRYGFAEVILFEMIAQRIATAVDSALLFQQAQEAVRWREELLAVVSHDIKTPLLVMRMNAEMLLRAARPPEEERRRRHSEGILRAADQMHDLIGGILDRARLQGMPMLLESQPWAVDELFQKSLEMLQPLALDKQQQLVVEVSPGLPHVRADRQRILQVFANLVGNAIKFTPKGGTVTVRARQEDGRVRISVKDNGPGMSPEDVPHLFERFWRASGAIERGTGLGLSIVKSIVEAHGGSLWVETQVGAGSTFCFTLPAAEPPSQPERGH